jgi:dTDP-4-dehydrorhamnose reductase
LSIAAPTIAVIGATGQVGQEFAKLVPRDRLEMFGSQDVDVADRDSVAALFERIAAHVVVNLAAFHNTDGCENDPAKAFAVNALGAWHVAEAATRRGMRACFVSTDYVFGREGHDRGGAYTETDIPGPVNIYGTSKVAGEHLVLATDPGHLVVRTSSLFGAVTSRKGWTFPQMILRKARNGDRLRVVTDQVMAPTYTHDLVERILALLSVDASGVFHVANAGSCSWWDFATATLETAGVDVAIEPVPSSEFPTRAHRPAFSALGTKRLGDVGLAPLRPWRDALTAYLAEIGEPSSAPEVTI